MIPSVSVRCLDPDYISDEGTDEDVMRFVQKSLTHCRKPLAQLGITEDILAEWVVTQFPHCKIDTKIHVIREALNIAYNKATDPKN